VWLPASAADRSYLQVLCATEAARSISPHQTDGDGRNGSLINYYTLVAHAWRLVSVSSSMLRFVKFYLLSAYVFSC